jgi:MFS-type transporter involved in bile tolerance (Atg22 family)
MAMFALGRYHNRWEFWAYNFVFGFFQTPYFAYSKTVMAELCPPGFDYMVRAVS